ncbi:MAG: glycosyltransferase, partial [Chloroflexota bacterium]
LMPVVYRTIPVLMMHAREFDFPHEPYPTVHYAGPMINVSQRASGKPENAELTALLEKHNTPAHDRRLIYCTFGTFIRQNDLDFIVRLVRAVEGQANYDVVFGLGKRHTAEAIRHASGTDLPNNVYIFDWVPQLQVLEKADCAVHHGGTSTVNECIYYEVPMLLYPLGIDQKGNAARVAYHNMGILGDRNRDTPEQIRQHLATLMDDGQYRSSLQTMKRAIDDAGCNPAATFVEQLLSR